MPALRGSLPALLLLLIGLAACRPNATPERPPASAERPPNIIFIMADDLGYGDLGAYGQERILTPHIDRLAAEGLRFTSFYAGSTVCAPSRSVLMTGRHAGHTYIRGNREVQPMGQEPLPDSVVTVAEVLKGAGYATGLVGKWGLGGPDSEGHPNRQGFDYFYGYLGQRHAHNYYPAFLIRNAERVPLGNKLPEPARADGAGKAVEKVAYSHDLIAEEALAFVERNQDGPFFLYLALTIPHANNEAGAEGMEVPDYGDYAGNDWPAPQQGLAAMISRMDRDVGRLMERLDALGLDDNTIVFFTSDNGPHAEGGNDPGYFDSNGPLRGIKRDLYEGGIRVPMIVRWPGRTPAGTTTDHPGYFGDFLVTAAELSGAATPPDHDGISLLPTLTGRDAQQAAHPYLYWEFYERGSAQAVRVDHWKGVRQPMFTGEIELYDLDADLGEEQNVAPEHPDVVARVREIMDEAHRPSPMWRVD
jgi:uncharacterized sulfatase